MGRDNCLLRSFATLPVELLIVLVEMYFRLRFHPGSIPTSCLRKISAFFVCLLILPAHTAAQASGGSSRSGETFTLTGTVTNSVTGEAVGHALVRISGGMTQRTCFADSEGHFQLDGLPAAHVAVTAQKPGYFGEEDLPAHSIQFVSVGPGSSSVVLKLAPSAAIWGRILDSAGQPIEHLPVQLVNRNVREGRKHMELRGSQQTDEDGKFRFANLMPGTYYVLAGPGTDENRLLAEGQQPKFGYPGVYYPGVLNIASASPIQLTPGQQSQADISLSAGPVYHIAGVVTGYLPAQGVGLQFFSQSGDEVALPTRFNMETGVFQADSVPAGIYILKAFSQSGTQLLRAETQLTVNASTDNVRLTLTPVPSIPIVVHMESRASTAATQAMNQGVAPVNIRLNATAPMGTELYSTMLPNRAGGYAPVLQNVDPGTYSVILSTQGDWYVASAQYGQTNLLYDDLSVASGQAFPIDIVLRDDGATLNGTVKTGDGPARATVVVAPERAAKGNVKVVQSSGAEGFMVNALAPGDYLVFAFDYAEGIEYTNPDGLQPYISQAAHVTLSANQKSQVTLDLIRREGGD